MKLHRNLLSDSISAHITGSMHHTITFIPNTAINTYHNLHALNTSPLVYEIRVIGIFKKAIFKKQNNYF